MSDKEKDSGSEDQSISANDRAKVTDTPDKDPRKESENESEGEESDD